MTIKTNAKIWPLEKFTICQFQKDKIQFRGSVITTHRIKIIK